ncbi:copper chaperone PCu(A)C [Kitasatospora sp. MBT63]|uniref:copper chaperone PCu(A)C n=1 Tax=Kitasatospora sp. MBT63 TaxID=1444768 RepID=UPI00068BEE07|nr:copper chaperone PCu(A)C [Kitasatospora sp. MBT63]
MRISGRALPVAAPVAAAAVTLLVLGGWVTAGAAGRAGPVQVEPGWVLVPAGRSPVATAAFFTVRNPGDVPDELIGASTAVAAQVTLSRHEHRGGGARPAETASLPVPARGALTMDLMSADLVLARPEPLTPGRRVEFRLRFRRSGEVRVAAVAVTPQQLTGLLAAGAAGASRAVGAPAAAGPGGGRVIGVS